MYYYVFKFGKMTKALIYTKSKSLKDSGRSTCIKRRHRANGLLALNDEFLSQSQSHLSRRSHTSTFPSVLVTKNTPKNGKNNVLPTAAELS